MSHPTAPPILCYGMDVPHVQGLHPDQCDGCKKTAFVAVTPPECDSPECMPCRIQRIERLAISNGEKLDAILSVMTTTEGTIKRVADEVMPTIEMLAKSPMVKALGFGGKK
jgi:hypothetical protein